MQKLMIHKILWKGQNTVDEYQRRQLTETSRLTNVQQKKRKS